VNSTRTRHQRGLTYVSGSGYRMAWNGHAWKRERPLLRLAQRALEQVAVLAAGLLIAVAAMVCTLTLMLILQTIVHNT
jgi:hypothetical protein